MVAAAAAGSGWKASKPPTDERQEKQCSGRGQNQTVIESASIFTVNWSPDANVWTFPGVWAGGLASLIDK
jgi:hypothetical protein